MPNAKQKKRAQNRKYYQDHKEKLSLQAYENYAANGDKKKKRQLQWSILKLIKIKGWLILACITINTDEMKAFFSEYYEAHKHEMKASFGEYYEAHKD